MSFGSEVKDFASAFRSTSSAIESSARTDAYNARADKDNADFDFADEKQFQQTGKHKAKKHSAVHNLGHMLGLNSDERDVAQPGSALPVTSSGNMPSVAPISAVDDTSSLSDDSPDAPEYYGQDDDTVPQYKRGGMVKSYALGGPVEDDDDDPTTPMAPAAQPDLPAQTSAPVTPTPRPALDIDSTDEPDAPPTMSGGNGPPAPTPAPAAAGDSLGDALHAGITTLKSWFDLDQPDQDGGMHPHRVAGQRALMNSIGRPSDQDYDAAAKAVDPQGQLNDAQLNLRVMEKGYEFYMQRGQPDKANNYAASIVQYATYEASKYGQNAMQELRKGDVNAAAAALQKGYNSIPTGDTAADFDVNPDGSVTVQQVDTKTGKQVATHTMSGKDLFQAAVGLSNKSGTWQALMNSASERKGLRQQKQTQLTPADIDAISGLYGTDASGIPKDAQGNIHGAGVPAPMTPGTPDAAPTGDVAKLIAAVPADKKPYMTQMLRESSGNPAASNGSSVGLYQFTPDTWKNATGQEIPKNVIGTAKDPRLDAQDNIQAMEQLTDLNTAAFQHRFGRDPSPQELAVMHQQGTRGGMELIAAPSNSPANKIVSTAALVQNRIPANATAADAVKAIQNFYYGGRGKSGSASSGAPAAAGPLGLQEALPEDQIDTGAKPNAPESPQWIKPDAQKLAVLSPAGQKAYMQNIRQINLQKQKDFQDAQQKYHSDVVSYTAAQKAATKSGVAATPPDKRGALLTDLNTALEDTNVSKMFASKDNPVGPSTVAAKPIAFGLYSNNNIEPGHAWAITASLLSPGQQNFEPHKMPNGNFKLVMKNNGQKFVVDPNTFDQIAATRGAMLAQARKAGDAAAASAARGNRVMSEAGDVLSSLRTAPHAPAGDHLPSASDIGRGIVKTGAAAVQAIKDSARRSKNRTDTSQDPYLATN